MCAPVGHNAAAQASACLLQDNTQQAGGWGSDLNVYLTWQKQAKNLTENAIKKNPHWIGSIKEWK